MTAVLAFEFAILDWMQANLRNPLLDLLMPDITALGNGGLIWLLLAAVLICIPRYRKAGAAVLAGLALEVVCCNLILKPLVARIRPFAAAAALHASGNRLWIPSLILAALIAWSRLYLYVHDPSDVLAGAVIGMMAGWTGSKLMDAVWRKRNAA